MLEKYIEQFEKEFETNLKQKKPGSFILPLNNQTILIEVISGGGFKLSAEISDIKKENEEPIYFQALKANLFGQGTKGAILGLNDRGNILTISRTVDYNVDYKDFREIIEDFINAVDFWKEQTEIKV